MEVCRDREVLDLGCIQHSAEMSLRMPRRWLHAAICEVAAACTGVDYLEQDAHELNARGYNIVPGNVLVDEPPGQFDVVVAGDLIEHLENPFRLLTYMEQALRPGGVAVITTPNCFFPGQLATIIGRRAPIINPEHVLFFDPFTFVKLVERSPLRVARVEWLDLSWWPFWDSRHFIVRKGVAPLTKQVIRWAVRRRPYLASDFAVFLERNDGSETGDTAEQRAEKVMAFHEPRRRREPRRPG